MLFLTCKHCFEDLPKTTDYFYRRSNRPSFRPVCKKCTKILNKKYYKNNHPRIGKKVKEWKEKHPVEDLKHKRNYYHKHKKPPNFSVNKEGNEKTN